MLIEAVDQEPNLYRVNIAMPDDLVTKILHTPWLDLPWNCVTGHEQPARRQIQDSALPWAMQWDLACHAACADIGQATGQTLCDYQGTVWWLDEPGFTDSVHPNGEPIMTMQLYWIGARIDLGTTFYWYQDRASKRCQFPMTANSGYITVNRVNNNGSDNFLWNGMLTPVPPNTFRLVSHSWFVT